MTRTIYRGAGAGDAVVVLLRAAAQDARLSFTARGVLFAAMSRSSDWRSSGRQMAEESPQGRDAVLTALRELERYGYLRRVVRRDDRGRIRRAWEITDSPGILPGQTKDGSPGVGTPGVGAPGAGKPGRSLRESTKGETPPPTPAADDDADALHRVVVGEIKGKAPRPRADVVVTECRRLAAAGWTPEALAAAIRGHDWTGARAGAVVAFVRSLNEPPPAAEPAQERPAWCGACDEPSRRLTDAQGRPRRGSKCPTCHPDTRR